MERRAGRHGASLADRLAAARHRRFVGRREELSVLAEALRQSDSPPFAVLALYGPGGTGKSMLLGEYARIAREAGWRVAVLDARNLQVTPQGIQSAVEAAIAETMHGEVASSPLALLLDTCEALAPLDTWVRDVLLPQMPENSITVMASRNPPDPAWLSSPGWNDLLRVVPLRNLHPDESRAYLQHRGVPLAHRERMVEFTHGHPLALSLVADVLESGGTVDDPRQDPNIVRTLTEHLLRNEPSPLHRQALEIAALSRVTTESLLTLAFGEDQGHLLFGWLQRLSFMEHHAEGLFPHDLVRDVIDADLRWRHPQRYEAVHRTVHDHVVRRIRATQGLDQQRALHSLMFLHRNNPLWQPYIGKDEYGHNYLEPAAPDDASTVLEIVGRHEGEESAQIARHWLRRQPEAFWIVRGLEGQVTGIIAMIQVDQTRQDDIDADPALRRFAAHVERHHPLRPGDRLGMARFVMGNRTYRNPSTPMCLSVLGARSIYTEHRLAWTSMVLSEPEFWEPYCRYILNERIPGADFDMGGRTYSIYVHDWRAHPVEEFDEVAIRRELSTTSRLEPVPLAAESEIALSRTEFDASVRRALRAGLVPARLVGNALLRSRLIAASGAPASGPERLRSLIMDGIASLAGNARTERYYRALHRTYIDPAPTQEAAAEDLDLPFSTYRRHLTTGIDLLTEHLWQREIDSGTRGST